MSVNKKKLLSKVSSLSVSLDELEARLGLLFSQPLPEVVASLDSLQQAKLHVMLPYLINDLIFIYLRTRGVDPKTHPVIAELARVRQYFTKIKDAEEAGQKRALGIDKAAAGRFIRHAISQARQSATTSDGDAGPSQPSTSKFISVQVTEKMRERKRYQQELAAMSDSEEAVLEVIEDDELSNGKGKGVAQPKQVQELLNAIETKSEPQKKKRRRPIDLFGPLGDGLGEDVDSGNPKKKSKQLAKIIGGDAASISRANSDTDTATGEKVSRKKKNKKVEQPAEV